MAVQGFEPPNPQATVSARSDKHSVNLFAHGVYPKCITMSIGAPFQKLALADVGFRIFVGSSTDITELTLLR